MKRFLLVEVGLACLMLGGCTAATSSGDCRDAAAVDLAVATMDQGPTPEPLAKCTLCKGTGWITHGDGHRTPCPDCQGDTGVAYGGPLDTLRDAKALIEKGNELADRGKALLDQAELDGKITVDIRLPSVPRLPIQTPPDTATSPAASECQGGVCRPRLFGRFRR